MGHEYKLLDCVGSVELSKEVTQHLADGWDLWGNPFVSHNEIGDQYFHQTVVRFDLAGHSVVGKLETALSEPAGYAVGVPETPEAREMQNGPTVEVPILEELQGRPFVEFAGGLCACYEKAGDNPECPIHRTSAPSGRVS
jgi:hypothetical protein